jgi:hypothetical protein
MGQKETRASSTSARLLIFVALLFSVGCVGGRSESGSSDPGTTIARTDTPALPPPPTATTCPAPIRLGVLLDLSKSITANAVPRMTEADLDALIHLVDSCGGGQLAIGALCSVSGDQPFTRLYVPPFRLKPVTAPSANGPADPFTRLRLANAQAAAASEQNEVSRAHQAARRDMVEAYRTQATGILAREASCTRTDVVSGANRLLTFLEEPWPDPAVAPRVVAGVYLTDGQDNVARQRLRLPAEEDVLSILVGGSPDAGALAPLRPARFEGLPATIAWLESVR